MRESDQKAQNGHGNAQNSPAHNDMQAQIVFAALAQHLNLIRGSIPALVAVLVVRVVVVNRLALVGQGHRRLWLFTAHSGHQGKAEGLGGRVSAAAISGRAKEAANKSVDKTSGHVKA